MECRKKYLFALSKHFLTARFLLFPYRVHLCSLQVLDQPSSPRASFQGHNSKVLSSDHQQGRDSTALALSMAPGPESCQPCSGPGCTLQGPAQPHLAQAHAAHGPALPLTSALLPQPLPGLPQRGAFSQPQPALQDPSVLDSLCSLTLALPHSHRAAPGTLGCLWVCPCVDSELALAPAPSLGPSLTSWSLLGPACHPPAPRPWVKPGSL